MNKLHLRRGGDAAAGTTRSDRRSTRAGGPEQAPGGTVTMPLMTHGYATPVDPADAAAKTAAIAEFYSESGGGSSGGQPLGDRRRRSVQAPPRSSNASTGGGGGGGGSTASSRSMQVPPRRQHDEQHHHPRPNRGTAGSRRTAKNSSSGSSSVTVTTDSSSSLRTFSHHGRPDSSSSSVKTFSHAPFDSSSSVGSASTAATSNVSSIEQHEQPRMLHLPVSGDRRKKLDQIRDMISENTELKVKNASLLRQVEEMRVSEQSRRADGTAGGGGGDSSARQCGGGNNDAASALVHLKQQYSMLKKDHAFTRQKYKDLRDEKNSLGADAERYKQSLRSTQAEKSVLLREIQTKDALAKTFVAQFDKCMKENAQLSKALEEVLDELKTTQGAVKRKTASLQRIKDELRDVIDSQCGGSATESMFSVATEMTLGDDVLRSLDKVINAKDMALDAAKADEQAQARKVAALKQLLAAAQNARVEAEDEMQYLAEHFTMEKEEREEEIRLELEHLRRRVEDEKA